MSENPKKIYEAANEKVGGLIDKDKDKKPDGHTSETVGSGNVEGENLEQREGELSAEMFCREVAGMTDQDIVLRSEELWRSFTEIIRNVYGIETKIRGDAPPELDVLSPDLQKKYDQAETWTLTGALRDLVLRKESSKDEKMGFAREAKAAAGRLADVIGDVERELRLELEIKLAHRETIKLYYDIIRCVEKYIREQSEGEAPTRQLTEMEMREEAVLSRLPRSAVALIAEARGLDTSASLIAWALKKAASEDGRRNIGAPGSQETTPMTKQEMVEKLRTIRDQMVEVNSRVKQEL